MKLSYKNKDIFVDEIQGIKQVDFEKVEELINDSLQNSDVDIKINDKLKKCRANFSFNTNLLKIYELPYLKENPIKYEIDVKVIGQLAQVETAWKDIEVTKEIEEELEEANSESTYLSK